METSRSNQLIAIRTSGETLTVSSLDFALGLDINHKSLLETIRTHQRAIEESFGLIAFETRKVEEKDSPFQTANLSEAKRSTKPQTVAYLTEDQALFVGTLSRNSKRVVDFKATLVKSFADARQRLQPAPTNTAPALTDPALLHLLNQQTQLMATQQELLAGLRADVEAIKAGNRPPRHRPAQPQSKPAYVANSRPPHQHRPSQQIELPGLPPPRPTAGASLRQAIHRHVDDYSAYYGAVISQTYGYLYKRLFEVYGLSVHRLSRQPSESLLDVLERYGELERLHALALAELVYPHE